MPDRRIDAIGKIDAARWNTVALPKNAPHALKVISGTLTQMKAGEVMHAMVQKAGQGAFKISLNGETFLIKGLPASLAGKEVAFMTQKSMLQGHVKNELLWLGASSGQQASRQPESQLNRQSHLKSSPQTNTQTLLHNKPQNELQSKQQVDILSALPSNLKTNKTFTGRINSLHGQQMSISIMAQSAENPDKNINHQILTTAIKGRQAGQTFAAKILSGANTQAKLEISSPHMMPQAASKAGNLNLANFKLAAGDTTTGFVQQRLANGQVQLNIQGISVETDAPNTVKKGDVLILKMVKPPAGFQLLSVHKNATAKALASLKTNIPINQAPVAQNIAAMRNIMATLPPDELARINALAQLDTALTAHASDSQRTLDGQRMSQIMRHTGASLEAKLLNLSQQLPQHSSHSAALQHDLKAIMLQLANPQTGSSRKNEIIKILSELGQQSVARIETGQALNILAHMQGEAMRLELPMLVHQQMINVQLSILQQEGYASEQADDGESSKQSYNVLFALQLSQLGHIRVDANISDSTVHARIYNENPDSHHFILDNIQRLEIQLQNLGFKKVHLLSSLQQPEADKQQRFEQLKQMTPNTLNLLDIRI